MVDFCLLNVGCFDSSCVSSNEVVFQHFCDIMKGYMLTVQNKHCKHFTEWKVCQCCYMSLNLGN